MIGPRIDNGYYLMHKPVVRKVYAKNPGETLAVFEATDMSIPRAIQDTKRAGFRRAMVLIK